MKKSFILGVISSALFAFTFILNRSMNLSGGYWAWSSSLRYFFTLPLLWCVVKFRGGTARTITAIREKPLPWLIWSTVGFGLFYAPLTLASVFGESWFTSATWQITIVCGVLLTPLFGSPIPGRNLLCSAGIIVGVILLQISHAANLNGSTVIAFVLILSAAFAYPLGNREMMRLCRGTLSTPERVFGMTLCSIPFWVCIAVFALMTQGLPAPGQLLQSFLVALFSGVCATLLFFEATRRVSSNPRQLAVVEATQCGEVIFTLIGGIIFLGDALPSITGFIGIIIIIAGMIINSVISSR